MTLARDPVQDIWCRTGGILELHLPYLGSYNWIQGVALRNNMDAARTISLVLFAANK